MKQAEAIMRREPPPLPGNGPYRTGMIDIPWAYEPDDDSPNARHAAVPDAVDQAGMWRSTSIRSCTPMRYCSCG